MRPGSIWKAVAGLCLLVLGWPAWLSAQEGPIFSPARSGYDYTFPRDHGSHEAFQTEWWYFTGHLFTEAGRRFGYELTFFRRGIDHPDARKNPSVWAIRHLYLAHFALTDESGDQFRMAEKVSRAGIHKAGAQPDNLHVWIDRWFVQAVPGHPHRFDLQAQGEGFAIDLEVESRKPPVVHGVGGVSKKGEQAGETSHYYSLTRLTTKGTVQVEETLLSVEGESWMDHEFGSADLAEGLVGWDWFSIQLANGREIMAYWLREANGTFAPASSGTLVNRDGSSQLLTRDEMEVTVEKFWTSSRSGARYPNQWQFTIPSREIALQLIPRMAEQELVTSRSTGVTYWEGAVDVTGTWQGRPIEGRGYVELTGYAKPYRPGS
ncbi:MAG: lipocalin-like domain-containing protein [Nitrospirales bacterium]|nr:carotenoid 1,2-hydratase [Nitrospirales bacterium]